ncbi:unnamed protein product [Allacma fusca]|uniref:Elongation of very long chain fatty acids protein n=1 Tax=Allacma fusca TaxID=39272 RepID=A0A8J2L6L3_9HEXA|nr:unnamed protein product [Allacma fusca]
MSKNAFTSASKIPDLKYDVVYTNITGKKDLIFPIFTSFKMDLPYQNITNKTDYVTAYDFEVFDVSKTISLMKGMKPLLFGVSGLYLILTFAGRKFMQSRPPFQISSLMVWWNVFNAAFGLVATLRAAPETLHLLLNPDGVYNVICKMDVHNYATSFWWLMFVVSKFLELGDTAFIVLRKQPLSILHWWHHSTTLLITWYSFELYDPMWRTFVLNTSVHFFMYTYYTLKALGFKLSRKIAFCITTMQIVQILILIYLHMTWVNYQYQGVHCQRPTGFAIVQFFPIIIFLGLLLNFYFKSYLQPKKSKLN